MVPILLEALYRGRIEMLLPLEFELHHHYHALIQNTQRFP